MLDGLSYIIVIFLVEWWSERGRFKNQLAVVVGMTCRSRNIAALYTEFSIRDQELYRPSWPHRTLFFSFYDGVQFVPKPKPSTFPILAAGEGRYNSCHMSCGDLLLTDHPIICIRSPIHSQKVPLLSHPVSPASPDLLLATP